MSDFAVLLENGRANTPVPTNTAAPVVSGSGKNGQELVVTTGTWNGNPREYAYQWRQAGVAIVGATGSKYTPKTADVTKAVDCMVTARNLGGAGSQASNAITIATNP